MKQAIVIDKLSKKFKKGEQESYSMLRDSIADWFTKPHRKLKEQLNPQEFWALKDISFTVKQGEAFAIIGKNGAGKSTLLKILSRITPPTKGSAKLKGRVGSLLEVGTGFHPELTGRENIFLNGAILGMSQQEVKAKFDEIVNFAEIEQFLETPLKRYSSGMYMRLAFAVAAHLDPEILLVDEVLAVGDREFQKKCLGKMGDVAGEGRTVLFVSHNMTAVRSLCSRGILLDKGKIKTKGSVEKITSKYLAAAKDLPKRSWSKPEAPGANGVFLRSAELKLLKKKAERPSIQTPLGFEFTVWNEKTQKLNFSVTVNNREGITIFNTVSESKKYKKGIVTGMVIIPENFLNDETYVVNIMLVKDASRPLFQQREALVFEVFDDAPRKGWLGKWGGLIRPQFEWQTKYEKY